MRWTFALAFVGIEHFAWGQSAVWQPQGATTGSVYYNGGNVGIGTSTPFAKFTSISPSATPGGGIGSFGLTTGGNYGGGIGIQDYSGNIGLWADSYGTALRVGFGTNMGPLSHVFSILSSGSVGVGTTAPSSRLEIVGNATSTAPQLRIGPVGISPSTTSLSSNIDFYSTFDNVPGDQGPRRTATIKAHYSGGAWGNEVLAFRVGIGVPNESGQEPQERMRISGNGNVGIGTTSPTHKLSVKGTIRANEVIVDTGWSDYVFRPEHRLLPLSEVDRFIRQYGHLPEIPSEAEVKEKGVSLGDMQAKLLAKIEELTLHLIEQDKANSELRKRLSQLESQASGQPGGVLR